MKKMMSLVAIALLMAGSVAMACDTCGCTAKKADKKAECATACSTEKKAECTAEKKAECAAACSAEKKADASKKAAK